MTATMPQAVDAPPRTVRVLHVVNGLGVGGAERQLVSLVSNLDRARFAPEVAVLEAGGPLARDLARAGVPVRPFTRRGRFSFGFLPALVRHARSFDVLHAWLTPAVLFGLLAGRLARVPVLVGTERGSAYARPSDLHPILLRAEARLLRGCACVVANSQAGARYAAARGIPAGKTHVIYNALPADWPPPPGEAHALRASLDLAADALVVLVAASFRPKKDHHTLLDALERLEGGAPLVALLAGDGPLRAEVEASADARGLSGRVRFLGLRDDVHDLLSIADIAALPSREREGCSNFLMEAMSLGVPVIGTDAGGTPEIIRDEATGLVVPAGDAAALAGAIERLARNPGARRAMGTAAAADAQARFGLDRMVRETTDLYVRHLAGGLP